MKKLTLFPVSISFFLFGLVIFGVLISVNRLNMMGNNVFDGFFNQRYLHIKTETVIHIVFGLCYLLLAPVLFLNRAFKQSLRVHRILGKICLFSGFVLGAYALIMHHQMATGLLLSINGWFFGILFLSSLLLSYFFIKKRDVLNHQIWMIRGFCIGLGAFVIVRVFSAITFGAFTNLDLLSSQLAPDLNEINLIQSVLFLSSWMGTVVPMLLGELYICRFILKNRGPIAN